MKSLHIAAALFSLAAAVHTVSAASPPLSSGGNIESTLSSSTSDTWTISVKANDSLLLRLAKKTPAEFFTPTLRLYAPDGALIDQQRVDPSVATVSHRATQTGTYTATVTPSDPVQAGTYVLRLLQMPAPLTIPAGDEGGALTSGQNHDGVIDLGDLDAWTFQAAANDVLLFGVGKTGGGLTPHLRFYGPDGAPIDTSSSASPVTHRVTQAGTYTFAIADSPGGNTGSYRLNAIKLPGPVVLPAGDEGGPLATAQNHDGIISPADLDAWNFTAVAGEMLFLRLSKLSGTATLPRLLLYAPDGALIGDPTTLYHTGINHTATQTGTYTAIVTDSSSTGTGTYRLTLQRGSASIALTSGLNHDGVIEPGDIDTWSLSVETGEALLLRLNPLPGTSTITPYLRLFAPDGTVVAEQAHASTAAITYRAAQRGTYFAVVTGQAAGETGPYRLRYLKAPDTIATSPGDEGGILLNNQPVDGTLPVGDIDGWIIATDTNVPVTLTLTKQAGATAFTPYLVVYDKDGAQIAAQSGPTSAVVTFTPGSGSLFTVVAQGTNVGDAGSYRLTASGTTTPLPPTSAFSPTPHNIPPTQDLYGPSVVANGSPPLKYLWRRNGIDVGVTSSPFLSMGANPAAGVYSVKVYNLVGSIESNAVVLGVDLAGAGLKLFGHAIEFASNIAHPNGNIYDQILLTGHFAAVRADPGQVLRISYLDLNDDIVQVEFSGAGTLTINLTSATGPTAATKYNQPGVQYMKGHASLTLAEADATTHLSAFTVGSVTAVNQTLFKPGETYDGVADLGLLAIQSVNGRIGSLRFANTEFFDASGLTGIFAPGVQLDGPVNVHNVSAVATATPLLVTGAIDTGRIGITGGDMLQINNKPVQVGDVQAIAMLAGATSHGVPQPAQTNQAQYERNGVNVTAPLIQNP